MTLAVRVPLAMIALGVAAFMAFQLSAERSLKESRGEEFDMAAVEAQAEAVRSFDTACVNYGACMEDARRFDTAWFREVFPRAVRAALSEGPSTRSDVWPRISRRPASSRRPGGAGRVG